MVKLFETSLIASYHSANVLIFFVVKCSINVIKMWLYFVISSYIKMRYFLKGKSSKQCILSNLSS